MDNKVEQVLRNYHERIAKENSYLTTLTPAAMQQERDDFFFPVGPEVGALLNSLVKGIKAQRILEVGTSHGYSTVWLAEALTSSGGIVVTLDYDPGKQDYARQRLAEAGLLDRVEFKTGDAFELLAALDGEFDFVLIDLWKEYYVQCFDLVYPLLKPGALVVADNILLPKALAEHGRAYQEHVRAHADIESMLLDIGQGIELSRYTGR